MIAYCGIDCSKCDAYIATITNDSELKTKTAKDWSKLTTQQFFLSTLIVTDAEKTVQKRYFVQIYVL